MKEATHATGVAKLRRVGLIAAAATAALLLTFVVVFAQGPNFDESYKSGPTFAEANEVITYTIVAVNTGDPVQDVVLSDTIPSAVTLLSCSVYTEPEGTALLPCDPTHLWTRDFATGERVTTTLTVQVNPGTLQFPLVNEAHISWPEAAPLTLAPVETIVNPVTIYLPIVTGSGG